MKRLVIVAIVFLLAAALGYFFTGQMGSEKETIELATKPCELPVKPCIAESGSFSLVFNLPDRIEYLKMFEVQVETTGWKKNEIEKVDVEFTMPGMTMGTNRFTLNKSPVTATSSQFKGHAVLPVCVTGRVDWIAQVRVLTRSGVYTANFPFSVSKQ